MDDSKAATREDALKERTRRQRHEFDPEIVELICDRIAEGQSPRRICQDANMPARSTVFVWLEEHEDFARSYTLARQIQIEDLMDEILEIADDSTNDWIVREGPDGKKTRVFNRDNFRRSKLQIAARKWLISKLMPKKFSWEYATAHTIGPVWCGKRHSVGIRRSIRPIYASQSCGGLSEFLDVLLAVAARHPPLRPPIQSQS